MEELVDMSVSNEAALCQDPHAYAPMIVERDSDLADCSDSFYEAAMVTRKRSNWHCASSPLIAPFPTADATVSHHGDTSRT